jgi:hypothetical protein
MKSILKLLLLIVFTFVCLPVNAEEANKNIDLMSDDFSVLKHIGRKYIKDNYQGQNIQIKGEFGITYKSYGDLAYPKFGFIGFELTSDTSEVSLLKLQLYKDAEGWRVERVLENSKIHQANPTHDYESGHARTDQTGKAEVAAAIVFEDWLNKENLIKDVRTTSMRCYLTKDLKSASCRGVYGLLTDAGLECHAKNYLLKSEAGSWKVVQEIRDDQKVSGSTGELITYKPLPMHCR